MGFCFSIFSISIRTSSSVSIRVNIIVLALVLQSSSAGWNLEALNRPLKLAVGAEKRKSLPPKTSTTTLGSEPLHPKPETLNPKA